MQGTSLTLQLPVQHPQGDQNQHPLSYKSVRLTLTEVLIARHCLQFIISLHLNFSPAQGGWLVNRMTGLLVPVAFGYQIQMAFSILKSCVSVDLLLSALSSPCPILMFLPLLYVLHHWLNNMYHLIMELYWCSCFQSYFGNIRYLYRSQNVSLIVSFILVCFIPCSI